MIRQAQIQAFVLRDLARLDEVRAYRAVATLICLLLGSAMRTRAPAVVQGLRAANRYWIDEAGSVEDVIAAQARVWEHLRAIGAFSRITGDPEVVQARALLCALYHACDEGEYPWDALYFFVDLIDRLGDYSAEFAEAAARVRERFGLD